MTFATLLSQNHVKNILEGIAGTQRIANAYLFAGPEKCGKTTAAIKFAKLVNCHNATNKPCGKCPACQKIDHQTSVDLYQLTYENSIKIEQVRDLKQHVQYGPHEEKYLIVLVPAAEKFTTEAANGFLKILEEPPDNVIFILETTNKEQLLSTIISRCQTIQFNILDEAAVMQIIREQYNLSGELARKIYLFTGGLINLIDFYITHQDLTEKFIETCAGINKYPFRQLSIYIEELTSKKALGTDKKQFDTLLKIILNHWHQQRQAPQARLTINYLKILKKNVNLKLTLETYLLKLKDLAYVEKK